MSKIGGKPALRATRVARRQRCIDSGACATAHAGARLRGLPPVWDERVRVLILGSFPGEASLAAGRYYAHPRNHFWPILGAVLELPLAALPYAERLQALLAAGVGLWDGIVACERAGSLDGAIRAPEWADPALALSVAPRLMRVCFNGQTAARAAPRWHAAGLATTMLPSTSPAYTRPLEEKISAWRAVGEELKCSTAQ